VLCVLCVVCVVCCVCCVLCVVCVVCGVMGGGVVLVLVFWCVGVLVSRNVVTFIERERGRDER
jgi:hypothetical protein